MNSELGAGVLKILSEKSDYQILKGYELKDKCNIKAITFSGAAYKGKTTKVFGYFGKPRNCGKDGLNPAILLIHGGGGHAFSRWVEQWNDRGYVAIAIDTVGYMPFYEEESKTGNQGARRLLWKKELPEQLKGMDCCLGPDNDQMEQKDKSPKEQWMYHAVLACVSAFNILKNDTEVDKTKIGVTGISWGGVIASILAGYLKDLAFAIPVYGSGFLSHGEASVNEHFKKVEKMWLAEERFSEINYPVFWIGWNDDNCFSMQPRDMSYRATAPQNPNTRLLHKNQMLHSHEHGWAPKEIERFANSIINGKDYLPKLSYDLHNDFFCLSIQLYCEEKIKSITIYYLTEPVTYSEFEKYPGRKKKFMNQYWKEYTYPVSQSGTVYRLPEKATGYYVCVTTEWNRVLYEVSTTYMEIKDGNN